MRISTELALAVQIFTLVFVAGNALKLIKSKKYSIIEHSDTDSDKINRIDKHLRDEYFSNPVIEIISKLTHRNGHKRKKFIN